MNCKRCWGSFIHQSASFCQAWIPFPWLLLTVQKPKTELQPVHFLFQKCSWVYWTFRRFLCREWGSFCQQQEAASPLLSCLKVWSEWLCGGPVEPGLLSTAVWLHLLLLLMLFNETLGWMIIDGRGGKILLCKVNVVQLWRGNGGRTCLLVKERQLLHAFRMCFD